MITKINSINPTRFQAKATREQNTPPETPIIAGSQPNFGMKPRSLIVMGLTALALTIAACNKPKKPISLEEAQIESLKSDRESAFTRYAYVEGNNEKLDEVSLRLYGNQISNLPKKELYTLDIKYLDELADSASQAIHNGAEAAKTFHPTSTYVMEIGELAAKSIK